MCWQRPRSERRQDPALHLTPSRCNTVERNNYCASTGFALWRPSARAVSLLHRLCRGDTTRPAWEQERLNVLLQEEIDGGFVFELLDQYKFNNFIGYKALAVNSRVRAVERDEWVVAHAGFTSGPIEKADVFRKHDMWLPGTILPIKNYEDADGFPKDIQPIGPR